MRHLSSILLGICLLCLSSTAVARAQTVVVAHPVSDKSGWVAFEVDHILRIEGYWPKPPVMGLLIYPVPMKRAHPISRFGESVIIALPKPGVYSIWKGYHVHNGYIPALSGLPATEFVQEINQLPAPTTAGSSSSNEAQYMECPICHQRHIRY
ncbi:MAG: hypothetical protein KA923_01295 [Opitutaceae bacterium]|nr:hypothetical protein [Opitutaceae bacterium]HOG92771.1 hypothetical protein [Opitutaceae bacterium]